MTDQLKKLNVAIASTVLANHRRELFAQLLVQGFTAVDAYEKAGYKRHDGNACTLAKHPEVQARLKEIRGELAAEKTGFPFGTSAIADDAKIWHEWLTTKPGLDAILSYHINGASLLTQSSFSAVGRVTGSRHRGRAAPAFIAAAMARWGRR
jgi:hypothetical protein